MTPGLPVEYPFLTLSALDLTIFLPSPDPLCPMIYLKLDPLKSGCPAEPMAELLNSFRLVFADEGLRKLLFRACYGICWLWSS